MEQLYLFIFNSFLYFQQIYSFAIIKYVVIFLVVILHSFHLLACVNRIKLFIQLKVKNAIDGLSAFGLLNLFIKYSSGIFLLVFHDVAYDLKMIPPQKYICNLVVGWNLNGIIQNNLFSTIIVDSQKIVLLRLKPDLLLAIPAEFRRIFGI